MDTIQTLKPNVSRAAAVKQMLGSGLSGLLLRALNGRLRYIAEVHVPFRLFRVSINSGAGRQEKLLAIDSVTGDFDLYSFDELPCGEQLMQVSSRNRPGAVLDGEKARRRLVERLRRMVYRNGFFRISHLQIEAEPLDLELHVPYWLGLSGHGERAHLIVIDGVRRRVEGGKIRRFFREWLSGSRAAQSPSEATTVRITDQA